MCWLEKSHITCNLLFVILWLQVSQSYRFVCKEHYVEAKTRTTAHSWAIAFRPFIVDFSNASTIAAVFFLKSKCVVCNSFPLVWILNLYTKIQMYIFEKINKLLNIFLFKHNCQCLLSVSHLLKYEVGVTVLKT